MDGTQQLTSGILLKLVISLVAETGNAMSSGVPVLRLRAKRPQAVAAGSAAATLVAAALDEEQWMHDVGRHVPLGQNRCGQFGCACVLAVPGASGGDMRISYENPCTRNRIIKKQ